MRYSIDINENSIQVIKFNDKGIRSIGSADFETESQPGEEQYLSDLTAALKKSAKAAKIPKGFGIPASIVAGGPDVVIRRFTWPQMTTSALKQNTLSELAPLLPGDIEDFSISHEIMRTAKNEDTELMTDDVLVAALPMDFIEDVKAAARKSGFKVERIDVRENSRIRLVEQEAFPDEDEPPKSYAILDFSQRRANMGLYLNGAFYSNRYFSAAPGSFTSEPEEEFVEPTFDENGEIIPPPEAPPKPKAPKRIQYDPNTLANDVVSIIDYMQYRERGASISCIMLIGEENLPGIEESLAESLDIPVYPTEKWLADDFNKSIRAKGQAPAVSSYLDAFGAGVKTKKPKDSLNLKGIVRPSKIKTVVLPVASILLTIAIAVFGGIYVLNDQYRTLSRDLDRLRRDAAMHPVEEGDYTLISARVNQITGQYQALQEFRSEFPEARDVLPFLFDTTLSQHLNTPVFINNVYVRNGRGNVGGLAVSLSHVADILEGLSAGEFVANADAPSTLVIPDPTQSGESGPNVSFNIPVALEIPQVEDYNEESEGDQ